MQVRQEGQAVRLQQLRQLSDGELLEREKDLFAELHKSRFESYDEEAKNPGLARNAKREIAQIKTILREREREAQRAEAGKSSDD
jgi:large subunit ribosomal protein L29